MYNIKRNTRLDAAGLERRGLLQLRQLRKRKK